MALKYTVAKAVFDCDFVETVWIIAKGFVEVASQDYCMVVSPKFCEDGVEVSVELFLRLWVGDSFISEK